jgi:hypothetical protein
VSYVKFLPNNSSKEESKNLNKERSIFNVLRGAR